MTPQEEAAKVAELLAKGSDGASHAAMWLTDVVDLCEEGGSHDLLAPVDAARLLLAGTDDPSPLTAVRMNLRAELATFLLCGEGARLQPDTLAAVMHRVHLSPFDADLPGEAWGARLRGVSRSRLLHGQVPGLFFLDADRAHALRARGPIALLGGVALRR